ncbi:MAG: HAD hydrolase family protein [Mediterraneibacter gnavus]
MFRYVISSNGAKVTDYHTQKTLYQSEIPKQTALSLLNACQSEKLGITAHIRHEYLLQGHSLVFLGRLIYGKDARKVRYVQNMEQTIQELSCDVEELQFYFFSKNSMPHLKMHLANSPSLRAAYTGQYAEIFSSEPSKGAL